MTNTEYPGRDNYTGPTTGYFALLHHDKLFEQSTDVMNRVAYVKREKSPDEIAVRLHHMLYLDPVKCPAIAKRAALVADYEAKRAPLDADYEAKLAPLDADYEAKRAPLVAEILAYIRSKIPDCAWDEQKHELSFAPKG